MRAYCAAHCGKILDCPNEARVYYCRQCFGQLIATVLRVAHVAPEIPKEQYSSLRTVCETRTVQ